MYSLDAPGARLSPVSSETSLRINPKFLYKRREKRLKKMSLRRMESMGHEETMRLAELYEEHPCLYNTNLASYTNRTVREQAWKAIADTLGKDVELVKSKVDNLRTQYTREKRKVTKRKTGDNADPLYKARWWLMGKMHFLNDFTLPRIEDSDILKREYDDIGSLLPEDSGELEESNDDPELQHIPGVYNEDWASTAATTTSSSDILHHFQYLNPHQTANMAKRQMTVSPYRERKRQRLGSGVCGIGSSVSFDTHNINQSSFNHTTTKGPVTVPTIKIRSSDERFCDYLCEEFKAMKDEQTKVTLRRNIMNLVYNAQLELHANQLETKDSSSQAVILSDDSNSVAASATASQASPQGSD